MKRYRETELGYKFDKVIFLGVFLIVSGFILYIFYINNFDLNPHLYFNCEQEICENPYYKINAECKQQLKILWLIPIYTTKDCKEDCDWCKEQLLFKGEYGTKPNGSFFINNAYIFSFFILILGFFINHKIHNKGKKFDIEIPITEKIIINRRKLKEWSDNFEKNKSDK